MRSRFILCFCLVFSGCSFYRVDTAQTSSDYYPPRPSAAQVAYLENVDRPHDVIGSVSVTTERAHSREEVVLKLRDAAAVMGGDAITDITIDAGKAWASLKTPELLKNAYLRVHYSAKVIVFK